MTAGYSLHIGLNSVDPRRYEGWDGRLFCAERDAESMEGICSSRRFVTKSLHGQFATRQAVIDELARLADLLDTGASLILTYAGHGSRIEDRDHDEQDGFDETWCLFDGYLIDDEIRNAWSRFRAGVRIVLISDSCYSGTVASLRLFSAARSVHQDERLSRRMPPDVALKVYAAHRDFYDSRMARGLKRVSTCSVILLAACQENQVSYEIGMHGAFTAALLDVWNNGAFGGNYAALKSAAASRLTNQSPNYLTLGQRDDAFERARVFTF